MLVFHLGRDRVNDNGSGERNERPSSRTWHGAQPPSADFHRQGARPRRGFPHCPARGQPFRLYEADRKLLLRLGGEGPHALRQRPLGRRVGTTADRLLHEVSDAGATALAGGGLGERLHADRRNGRGLDAMRRRAGHVGGGHGADDGMVGVAVNVVAMGGLDFRHLGTAFPASTCMDRHGARVDPRWAVCAWTGDDPRSNRGGVPWGASDAGPV